MIFDVYHDGFHAIDIYVPWVRYEIKGGRAYEVTRKGRREVSVMYAQQRVSEWQEREAKLLTVAPPTRRQLLLMTVIWTAVAAGLFGALWMVGMW